MKMDSLRAFPGGTFSIAARDGELGLLASADVLISPTGTPRKEPKRDGAVPAWTCQLSVALTQLAFVIGSVYLKSNLKYVDEESGETFHPIVYAFIREAVAGPILYLLAWLHTGTVWPSWHDAGRVVALGVCMFTSQLFYIMGIELSGVTIATCIQPAIPVFTALLGVALQMESAHPQKLLGIAMAVAGSICMVAGGVSGPGHDHLSTKAAASLLAGNLCLLVNTFAMACYYILAKQVVQRYPAIVVSAWAYIIAASCMASTALVFTEAPDWHFPRAMVLPLAYWISVCSVMGYLAVTWAMKHLPASQVAAFQCLQPFIGTALAYLYLGEHPTWWSLGAAGVLAGLVLVIRAPREGGTLGAAAMVAQLRRATSHMGLLVSSTLGSSKSMTFLAGLPAALGPRAPPHDQ